MKDIKNINYEIVYNKLETLQIRNNFYTFIQNFYLNNFKGIEISHPIIAAKKQFGNIKILEQINFTNINDNQIYQLNFNCHQNLIFYLEQFEIGLQSSFFSRIKMIDKNCTYNPIVSELDFLIIKLNIVQPHPDHIINYFKNFWRKIFLFSIQTNVIKKSEFQELLQINKIDYIDIRKYPKRKINFQKIDKVIESEIFTKRVFVFNGIYDYNQREYLLHCGPAEISPENFWSFAILTPNNEIRILATAFFTNFQEKQIKYQAIAICFNFSLATALITQKLRESELDYLAIKLNS